MGRGLPCIMRLVAVIPSITGISMSMVMTSGLSFVAISTASAPLAASPTTSRRGSTSSMAFTRRRKKPESSTTSTLMGIHPLLNGTILIGLG